MAEHQTSRRPRLGFNELLLSGVILVMATAVVLCIGLYLLPGAHLELPELEPAVRVAREADFPVGGSRVVRWGQRVILVVRSGEQRYAALQGAAPADGCLLRWEPESLRIVSPCRYVVYDLRGNVVAGLSTAPLQRYAVFTRSGVVYVTEA